MKKKYDSIEYRKKFCQPSTVRVVNKWCEKWNMSPFEVLSRIINDAVVLELEKEKEINGYKQLNK